MNPSDADVAKYGTGKWHRVLTDATRSWEREPNPHFGGHRWPPLNTLAPALEAKIAARWPDYDLGIDYLDDAQREALTLEELRKRFPEV